MLSVVQPFGSPAIVWINNGRHTLHFQLISIISTLISMQFARHARGIRSSCNPQFSPCPLPCLKNGNFRILAHRTVLKSSLIDKAHSSEGSYSKPRAQVRHGLLLHPIPPARLLMSVYLVVFQSFLR
jgi:hypothetical protein